MKKRLAYWLVILMALSGATAMISACSSRFGKLPDGERLERLKASPNYADGAFRNQAPTEMLAGGSRLAVMWKFLFARKDSVRPPGPLPMRKTDLKALDKNRDLAVWLGHSSVYLQMGGKRILIDPVFEDSAAPFSFLNKAFAGAYPYSAADMPDIDCLIISHDHWDHLEYPAMISLQPRIKAIVCPLGVGSHLEYWGFSPAILHEGDWYDTFRPEPGLTVHVVPARHFSGRWISNNKTLWAGFVLETPGRRVFYSGDSGYGPHFAEVGERFGGVDLAIMENGQYDPAWSNIHASPEEAARAGEDARAKALLPVHAGRFTIAHHSWDDPYIRITEASRDKSFRLLTPVIGEVVFLDAPEQTFHRWWEAGVTP